MKAFLTFLCLLGFLASSSVAIANATLARSDSSAVKPKNRSIEFLKAELAKARSNYVMVVAHRGYWHHAPENSMAAIKNAVEIGVDMVEVDARRTKDGVMILMHDKTLERTTNGTGTVADHTWEELQKLKLKTHEGVLTEHTIPTLEQVMNYAKGRVLVNIDKAWEAFQEIGQVLRKTGTLEIAVPKAGLNAQQMRPWMQHIQGSQFMAVIDLDKAKDPRKKIDDYISAYQPPLMELSFQTENSSILGQYEDLQAKDVKIWMTPCAPQWAAGHDDSRAIGGDLEGGWGWLLDHGATILLTNEPKALIAYLETKGRRNP